MKRACSPEDPTVQEEKDGFEDFDPSEIELFIDDADKDTDDCTDVVNEELRLSDRETE